MKDLAINGMNCSGAELACTPPAPAASPAREKEGTDWAGLWFTLLEREYGEFVGMRGGLRTSDDQIRWIFLSHADYDGIGGFVTLLRKMFPGRVIKIPSRLTAKPSWYFQAAALLRLLVRNQAPAAAWKGFDATWKSTGPSPGTEVSTLTLDAMQSRRLGERARAHRVALNTLLLSALDRACRAELEPGTSRWMMPVNMRGPVALARETANQTGYLQILMDEAASPRDVQHQVNLAVRRGDHWASWLYLNAGRLVGYGGMRRLYRFQTDRFGGRPFVGAFADLGRWEGIGQWCVCPPVALTCPLGAGSITCDGRLSLTIEAHLSIRREAGWTRALLNRWLAILDADHGA